MHIRKCKYCKHLIFEVEYIPWLSHNQQSDANLWLKMRLNGKIIFGLWVLWAFAHAWDWVTPSNTFEYWNPSSIIRWLLSMLKWKIYPGRNVPWQRDFSCTFEVFVYFFFQPLTPACFICRDIFGTVFQLSLKTTYLMSDWRYKRRFQEIFRLQKSVTSTDLYFSTHRPLISPPDAKKWGVFLLFYPLRGASRAKVHEARNIEREKVTGATRRRHAWNERFSNKLCLGLRSSNEYLASRWRGGLKWIKEKKINKQLIFGGVGLLWVALMIVV